MPDELSGPRGIPMNPEEIVRTRYSQAEAQFHQPTYQLGQAAPIQKGGWTIYSGPGLGTQAIGAGETREEAWIAAAAAVQAKEEPESGAGD
jgi:hypothetical protein